MNTVGRAVAAAVLGAVIAAAWAALLYAWHPAFTLEFDRDLPRNVSGIYGPERDEASGTTFAWTSEDAVVRLPGLDRRVAWSLALRVRGGRAAANPDLTILVDGVAIARRSTDSAFGDLVVEIPKRPERRGLTIGLQSSATFVPGPGDPRHLGVMLDRLAIAPSGIVLVPRPAIEATALSTAAMGAAIATLGVTAGSAIGAAVLLGAADAAILSRGFGPFTSYPSLVIRLACWLALATIGLTLAVRGWRTRPLRNTARFAAAFSAAALFLKLLVLLHPNMGVGDTMFHAHKFQGVLGGTYYFTSIAPGGYAFPYPPGLYVFASAFAGLVPRGNADMALLRVICASADAVAGLLLYTLVVRTWDRRLTGAMAVAIYQLMPLTFAVLTTGNMSNAFAQSLATVALVAMAWPVAGRRAGRTALIAALLLAAFLSHTGTLATLFASAVCIAALFLISGRGELRRAGATIAVATAIAAVIAVAVYYAHFMPTYRAEFARIGHETATAARDAGGRTIGDRLRSVPYGIRISIGTPVVLLALAGAVDMARRRRDRLSLALGGWLLACGLFLVLGVLTPVDMRYYLAALPAIAVAAAAGAAWAWQGWPAYPRLSRAGAAALLAAAVSIGVRGWWQTLG